MSEKDKFDLDQWEGRPAQEQPSCPPPAGQAERPMTTQEVLKEARQKHISDLERAIIGTPDPIPGSVHRTPKNIGPIVQRSIPIRYRNADEFDQEVQAGDWINVKDADTMGDWFIVSHRDSDRSYGLSMNEAIDRGLVRGQQQYKGSKHNQSVHTNLTQPRVHILTQGSVLCNFTGLRPVDWPKGHEWVPLDVQDAKETCNCMGCIVKWRELIK